MTLAILIVGALLVMQNDGFTVGMLVAFQMFASRMSQPLLRIVGLWQEFQQASIAVKRLGDILDMPREPHTLVPHRQKLDEALLTIDKLAFRYSEQHPWLFRNLDLAFPPGQLTVVTGPSGCGIRPRSANAAPGSRAGRSSASPLPGHCSSARAS